MIENEALAVSHYDPRDHYWSVETKPGEVYSSARRSFVTDKDSAYLAWSKLPGRQATDIACEVELNDVLLRQAPDHAIGRAFTDAEIGAALRRIDAAFDPSGKSGPALANRARAIGLRIAASASTRRLD